MGLTNNPVMAMKRENTSVSAGRSSRHSSTLRAYCCSGADSSDQRLVMMEAKHSARRVRSLCSDAISETRSESGRSLTVANEIEAWHRPAPNRIGARIVWVDAGSTRAEQRRCVRLKGGQILRSHAVLAD